MIFKEFSRSIDHGWEPSWNPTAVVFFYTLGGKEEKNFYFR